MGPSAFGRFPKARHVHQSATRLYGFTIFKFISIGFKAGSLCIYSCQPRMSALVFACRPKASQTKAWKALWLAHRASPGSRFSYKYGVQRGVDMASLCVLLPGQHLETAAMKEHGQAFDLCGSSSTDFVMTPLLSHHLLPEVVITFIARTSQTRRSYLYSERLRHSIWASRL